MFQLGFNQRDRIKTIVHENGGKYSPALTFSIPNTYLLLNKPEGDKYTYARIKNIPCLKVQWLFDSLTAKHVLPLDDYVLEDSIPVVNSTANQARSINSLVNVPSSSTNISSGSTIISTAKVSQHSSITNTYQQESLPSIISELSMSLADQDFFDDYVFYAVGFTAETIASIKKCVKRFGGILMKDFNSSIVNFVLIGDQNLVPIDLLKSYAHHLDKIVGVDWLLDCLRQGKSIDYAEYRIQLFEETRSKNTSQSSKIENDQEEDAVTMANRVVANLSKPVQLEQDSISVQSSDSEEEEEERIVIRNRTRGPQPRLQDYQKSAQNDNGAVLNGSVDPIFKRPLDNLSQGYTASKKVSPCRNNEAEEYSQDCRPRVFMCSGFEPEEKERLVNLITNHLRAKFYDDAIIKFEYQVTHYILYEPLSTEKTLSAIAIGAYILKQEYIEDSAKHGSFLPEENYEWGGQKSVNKMNNEIVSGGSLKPVHINLMRAAHYWRVYVSEHGGRSFFNKWKVLLLNESSRTRAVMKMVQAGGGQVYYFDQLLMASDFDDVSFDELIGQLEYAIFDVQGDTSPQVNKAKYFKYVNRLLERQVPIIQQDGITRKLLKGPEYVIDMERHAVTVSMMRATLSKFW